MNVHDERPSWLPKAITQAQFDEFCRLRREAVEALGLDPHIVILNGVRALSEGAVEVEFIVPPVDWDGTHPISAQVDEWRENEVRRGLVTLRVSEVAA